MTVSIRDAYSTEDRSWMRRAYGEYLEDLSAQDTGVFRMLDRFGYREPDMTARWFMEDDAHPLLILKGERPVGFALVMGMPPRAARREGGASGREPLNFRLAEFFVQRSHRRLGVGREAAQLIFSRFAGEWQVSEYQSNEAAIAFWRRVIGAYTKGQFTERIADGEAHQRFRSLRRSEAQ